MNKETAKLIKAIKEAIEYNKGNIELESIEEFLKQYINEKKKEIIKITIFDVSSYILERLGRITAMKLQKLVYYCQAWSLVLDESPLFKENIEVWANTPVVKELYEAHRGMYNLDKNDLPSGDFSRLDDNQKETIDIVLSFYGEKSIEWGKYSDCAVNQVVVPCLMRGASRNKEQK